MTPRISSAFIVAAVAAALVACGGGVIATLGAIGAAGGDFTVDVDPSTPGLQTAPSVPGNAFSDPLGINIQLDTKTNGSLWDNYFESSFGIVVNSGTLGTGACTAGLKGTVDGLRMDLGACFKGTFTSVNRIVSDDGNTVLLFGAFNPSLANGIWVDIHDESHRIKFKSDSAGCEYRGGTLTANAVTLVQVAADLPNGVFNAVRQFTIGTTVWPTGEYVGVSGLRLTNSLGTLELERRRDDPATPCA